MLAHKPLIFKKCITRIVILSQLSSYITGATEIVSSDIETTLASPITINNHNDSPLVVEDLLQSTNGNIEIYSAGDIILHNISCHGKLIVHTPGKVLFEGNGAITDDVEISALSFENKGSLITKRNIDFGKTQLINKGLIQAEKGLAVTSLFNNKSGHIIAHEIHNLVSILSCNEGTIEYLDSCILRSEHSLDIKGTLIVNGLLDCQLSGEDTTLTLTEGSHVKALKGATVKLHTLNNHGKWSVTGENLKLYLTYLNNYGDIESVNGTYGELFKLSNNAIIRTLGHSTLNCTSLENSETGKFYTAGVHHVNVKGSYVDSGYIYSPTLFLLQGSYLQFLSHHQSFIANGVIKAVQKLNIAKEANINIRHRLQLYSENTLIHQGTNNQLQECNKPDEEALYDAYYLLASDFIAPKWDRYVFKAYINTFLLGEWGDYLRSLLKTPYGLLTKAKGDLTRVGNDNIQAGSSLYTTFGQFKGSKAYIQTGYFPDNHAQIQANKGCFSNVTLSVPAGSACIKLNKDIEANRFHIQAKTIAELNVGGSMSLVDALFEARLVELQAQKDIQMLGVTLQGQGHINTSTPSRFQANDLPLKAADSGMQAHTVATIKAASLSASRLQMRAVHNQVRVQTDAEIAQSHLHADQYNVVDIGGTLESSQNTMNAETSRVTARNLSVYENKTQGTTIFEAQESQNIQDLEVDGKCMVTAQNIHLSGQVASTSMHVEGTHVINEADLQAKQGLYLKADVMEQLKTTTAGESSHVEGSERYIDNETSINTAGKTLGLVAKKTPRIKGLQKAPAVELHLATKSTEDFLDLFEKLETQRAALYLPQADLTFTHDITFKPDIYLEANRLANSANFTARGDFRVHLQTSFTNQGSMRIHGKGLFEAPDFIDNRGDIIGDHGLGFKTQGLLTHKGLFSGGLGALEIEAHRIDAIAESLNKRSIFLGDTISAQSETDFLADGAILKSRDATLIAGDLLRLGAVTETFHSEHRENSFFGLNTTTTRSTWQEGCVFEADCSEKLQLYSLKGHIKGEGASLSSPFMKIHGEKGVSLKDLRLTRIEEVEKSRPCFEVLGIDLFGPLEDGLPMPKPSVEVGARIQRTRTVQSYGVFGNIHADHLEISTGAQAVTDLQGSHLIAKHLMANTPSLKLGGSTLTTSTEDEKAKATAGVAYVGVFVPTASVSMSSNTDRVQGFQGAQVQIGHLENLWDGLQIQVEYGIQGGIQASSGKSFSAHIDYTQTIVSQGGWSSGFSMTGNNVSISGGGRWGEKRSSEGTSFDIISAPNLTHRIEQRYEDSDTRRGFNLSLGMSFGGSAGIDLTRGGFSAQVKDQTFSIDSEMFTAWKGSSTCPEASFFERSLDTVQSILGKARSVTSMASNITSAAALRGADVAGLQSVLDDFNSGLSKASYAFDVFERINQIRDAFSTLTTMSEEGALDTFSEGITSEEDRVTSPVFSIDTPTLDTQEAQVLEENASIEEESVFQNKGQSRKKASTRRLASVDPIVEDVESITQSPGTVSHDFQSDGIVVVSLNARDFMTDTADGTLIPETTYSLLSLNHVQQLLDTGEFGVQPYINPVGFFPLFEGIPQDFSRGFQEVDPHFVRLFSLPAIQAQQQMIADQVGEFSATLASGCVKGVMSTLILDGGPQAFAVVPTSCFVGAVNEAFQTYVPSFVGQGTYHFVRSLNFSETTAETAQQVSQGLTSVLIDSLRTPPILNVSSMDKTHRKGATLLERDYFHSHPTIESLDKRGAVRFKGVEIRAVRDLSHLPDSKIEAMARRGVAPYDIHGRPLQLHHLGQQNHRMSGGGLVMIPQPYHSLGNTRQHRLGNKGGIGADARKDSNKYRRDFYKEFGRQELLRRGSE